ncbi:hypothetical protein [Helicobacter cetorum]|uniref:Lipoprotein n=1 Tax=Helicobacter cetorum (strain ATCC BAA-540 / CCUG 52418 / MIT 99-5656) TaxID=1163745 RepID=I0ES20_HELCM|nr:hypothetical protein [Helicobacter cetorum]AFI05739.1 hypothetical protein HCD_03615 [Helicobacter cetorum MIT 99-5656]
METIRNSVLIGASLLSGCSYFDSKHFVYNNQASEQEKVRYTPKDFGDPYYTNHTHWDTRH